MWRVVPASVIGTAHLGVGTPCQDAYDFLRIKATDDDCLLIAIADGAGSATHSHIGSNEAVRHLLGGIPKDDLQFSNITEDLVRGWMASVLEHFTLLAEREQIEPQQLACTLLLAIICRKEAIFAQIGDGAWVIESDGVLGVATWPHNGEYANITTFITTQSALDTMQFKRVLGDITAVAGFTDGLQSLALEYATKRVHAPFFSPMLDAVRSCEDETTLIAPLQTFLASESITSRTDDDKTLVLASWRDKQGAANGAGQ